MTRAALRFASLFGLSLVVVSWSPEVSARGADLQVESAAARAPATAEPVAPASEATSSPATPPTTPPASSPAAPQSASSPAPDAASTSVGPAKPVESPPVQPANPGDDATASVDDEDPVEPSPSTEWTDDAPTQTSATTVTPTVSAPLPPPPPPIDPSTIRRGPWRGVGWVAVHVAVVGPLGGERPARPTVVSTGFGFEVGWRIHNAFAVATGITRQTHERRREIYDDPIDGVRITQYDYGELTNFDVVVARGYLPINGRVQPYAEVGGGIAVLEPTDPQIVVYVGGHGRAGLGVDAWIARNLTLSAGANYRLLSLDESIGHLAHGYLQFGVHW